MDASSFLSFRAAAFRVSDIMATLNVFSASSFNLPRDVAAAVTTVNKRDIFFSFKR